MAYRGKDAVTRRQSRFNILSYVIATILSIIAMLSYFGGTTSILSGFVKIVTEPLTYVSDKIYSGISSVGNYFGMVADLKEENLRLKAENELLMQENKKSEAIKEENLKLYSYLGLKREFSEMSFVNTRIISRGSGGMMSGFMIDKGTLHGVRKNMAVLDSLGIVGVITEEGLVSSRGVSILGSRSSVGVYIVRSGVSGILEGDFRMQNEGLCKLANIPQDADVVVGDYVYTSGLGDIFPKDLCVGTVETITKNAANQTLTLGIKPICDFDNLSTVMVLSSHSLTYEDAEQGD